LFATYSYYLFSFLLSFGVFLTKGFNLKLKQKVSSFLCGFLGIGVSNCGGIKITYIWFPIPTQMASTLDVVLSCVAPFLKKLALPLQLVVFISFFITDVVHPPSLFSQVGKFGSLLVAAFF